MNNNERDLLDLSKFEGQGGVDFTTRQTTLAYCEEGKIKLNISPYGMFRRGGEIYDVQSGLKLESNPKMEFGQQEIDGMNHMFELAENELNTIFWISPSGGFYVDARLVVARASRNDNGELVLDCRSIVVKKTPEQLMQIAIKMVGLENGQMKSWIDDSEGLRSQPIGFCLKDNEWIDFGKRMFGIDEVWDAIKKGEDIKQREQIEEKVRQVRNRVVGLGYTGRKLTQAFEFEMVREGYVLNAVGNHGGSSISPNRRFEVFDKVYNSSGVKVDSQGEVWHCCKACGCWYKGDRCPMCG